MNPRSSKMKQNSKPAATSRSREQAGPWSLAGRAAGCVLGLLFCGLFLLGAADSEEAEQSSREKIESMTPAEREQLKRNYEKFQKLTPAEQDKYRKLHAAVQEQPELSQVMHRYEKWVRTLSPWEQEDLRKAATPEARMELIRKFRMEQRRDPRWKGNRDFYEISRLLKWDRRDSRFMWIPSPPPELYQEVIGIIEKSLPAPVNDAASKDRQTGFTHTVAVLRTAVQVKRQDDEKGSQWPQPEVVDQIVKLLEQNQYQFRDFGDQRGFRSRFLNGDRQRIQVIFFLARGLWNQLVDTVRVELQKEQLSEDELHKFFETLDTNTKDYLLKNPPEELQEKLKFMYLRDHLSKPLRKQINDQSAEVRQVVNDLMHGIIFEGPRGNGGDRERRPNPNSRRKDEPDGRGDRPFRGGRRPDQGAPRRLREQSDA